MPVIPEEQIRYSELSFIDAVGRLFYWNGRIFRGIYPAGEKKIRALFESGCLEELTKRGLFPRTTITDYTLEGYALVVEHDAVPFVIYPHEWSFDMFRDSALAILEVIEVTGRFGWGMMDFNPFNVLFHSCRPVYVDLGSLFPLKKEEVDEQGADYHKFLKTFWRPLSIWSSGDSFLAQRIISCPSSFMPDMSWWLYRHSDLRMLSPKFSARWARRTDRWLRKVAKLLYRGKILSMLPSSLASRLPVEMLVRTPALLREKMLRLPQPPPSPWDNYHTRYLEADQIVSTPRFDRVLEIIKSLDCASVTELGGNQGLFSLLMARKTGIKKIVCTDYSSSAVNRFYNYCKTRPAELEGRNIEAAVINFMLPELAPRLSEPSKRLQADLVVTLAVTHHLVLSQKFHIQEVLRTIAAYTRKFAIIEFMPLGLWADGKGEPVPDWYTREWFEQNFVKVFDLVQPSEQLEANRIVFVGKLKGA